jgi:hypothetical protein
MAAGLEKENSDTYHSAALRISFAPSKYFNQNFIETKESSIITEFHNIYVNEKKSL